MGDPYRIGNQSPWGSGSVAGNVEVPAPCVEDFLVIHSRHLMNGKKVVIHSVEELLSACPDVDQQTHRMVTRLFKTHKNLYLTLYPGVV